MAPERSGVDARHLPSGGCSSGDACRSGGARAGTGGRCASRTRAAGGTRGPPPGARDRPSTTRSAPPAWTPTPAPTPTALEAVVRAADAHREHTSNSSRGGVRGRRAAGALKSRSSATRRPANKAPASGASDRSRNARRADHWTNQENWNLLPAFHEFCFHKIGCRKDIHLLC